MAVSAYSACGSGDAAPGAAVAADAASQDVVVNDAAEAGVETSGCKSPNASGPTADDGRWCKVDNLLDQALAEPASLPGYTFEVFTTGQDGTPVKHYGRSAGNVTRADGQDVAMSRSTPVKIASASKYLTAVTVLRAISKAADSAGKPAGPYLQTPLSMLECAGIDPALQQATLEQVLHQIAGLSEADHDCLKQIGQPVSSCACKVLLDQYTYGPPGSRFAYGSASFLVAAAMAEKLTGVGFKAQVDTFASELGVPPEQFEEPPGYNFAGGFSASVAAYVPFLALASPGVGRGKAGGSQMIDTALLDAMAEAFSGTVAMQSSPFVAGGDLPIRYGLGSWVQCSKPWASPEVWPVEFAWVADGLDYGACPKRVQHSLGMFGFMPWVSFGEQGGSGGHSAILGTHIEKPAGERVSFNSYMTFLMIEPVLDELLP